MNEEKVFMFNTPDAGGSKLDPNLFALMNGNGNRNNDGNQWWWIIILMLFGRNGFGGFGDNAMGGGSLPASLQGDAGRDLIMQAVNGNRSAIDNIASQLGCTSQAIQTAIGTVTNSITTLSGQVGLSGQQIINSIQAGNQTIAQQLGDCCCKTQNAITSMGYENQLASCQQTNALTNAINGSALNLRDGNAANTQAIVGEIRDFRTMYVNDKMDALREKASSLQAELDNARQTSTFGNMLAQAVAPINAGLNGLSREVDAIKCKQMPTTPVPYSPGILMGTYQAPLCGAAFGAGLAAGESYNNNGIW